MRPAAGTKSLLARSNCWLFRALSPWHPNMKIDWLKAMVVSFSLPIFGGAACAFAAGTDDIVRPSAAPAATAENDHSDEDAAAESEHARNLRRAQAEHESRRVEAARKLEAERARDQEITRTHGAVSGLTRRESFLRHEVYWNQRELDSISRDPADASAMARRGNVERGLIDLRNELDLTTPLRQGTVRQLDGLRIR